jgi:hypothetical protein
MIFRCCPARLWLSSNRLEALSNGLSFSAVARLSFQRLRKPNIEMTAMISVICRTV